MCAFIGNMEVCGKRLGQAFIAGALGAGAGFDHRQNHADRDAREHRRQQPELVWPALPGEREHACRQRRTPNRMATSCTRRANVATIAKSSLSDCKLETRRRRAGPASVQSCSAAVHRDAAGAQEASTARSDRRGALRQGRRRRRTPRRVISAPSVQRQRAGRCAT